MSNNGIPYLNDWQADNYPVIFDEGDEALKYVKTGNKIAVPGSGGGVEIKSETVILNDEQIKALPTTGVEIVAAPGAGKYISVIFGNWVLDATADSYGDITDASFQLVSTNGNYLSVPSISETALGLSAIRTSNFLCPPAQDGSGSFAGTIVTGGSSNTTPVIENEAVLIKDDWGGGVNYTGGNAANTLKVTVYYIEVTL